MSAVPADLASRGDAGGRARVGESLLRLSLRRFARNRVAMGSMIFLLVLALLSIVVPMVWVRGIETVNWDMLLVAPTSADLYLFGSDVNGRDLFVRTFYAGRTSLAIGVLATSVALVIGVLYGALAGYLGGWVDDAMMRFCDIMYSLPTLFFVIILITILGGRNILLVFLCIGCIQWLTMARIVRGQALSIRQREYVEAARAIGLPTWTLLRRYIVPNVIGPVIVYATMLIPVNILIESYLSFLGLGTQEPMTSWGLLISQGAQEIETAPWLIAFPATFLTVTLFCFNFIGDGLRDAFDPKDY